MDRRHLVTKKLRGPVFLVMPVANEASSIETTIQEVMRVGRDYELHVLSVVDDYSTDRTVEILETLSKRWPSHLHVLFYEQSTGVASCYIEGYRKALVADAEYVIEMDAGGSHKPQELPKFLARLEEGYDCVFGSRFIEGGGFEGRSTQRRLVSWISTRIANVALGTNQTDMTSGFEAFKAAVLRGIDFDNFVSKGHFFQTELRFHCRNLDWVEVPITYLPTATSLSYKKIWTAVSELRELRRRARRTLHR